MNFWRKLTIAWPCALGDRLWALLVVAPAAWLDRMTLRRAICLAVLFVVAGGLAQIVSADIAFLMAGDIASYYEIAALVFFIAMRGHARHALGAAMRVIAAAARGAIGALPRFAARQRRNANARRRGGIPQSSDDEPAGVYAFA